MAKLNWEKAGQRAYDPARTQRDAIYAAPVSTCRSKAKPTLSSFEHQKRTAIKHREREYNEALAEKKRQISRIEAMQVNDNRRPGERQETREARRRRAKRAEKANADQARRVQHPSGPGD
jgi:hypothetical protein